MQTPCGTTANADYHICGIALRGARCSTCVDLDGSLELLGFQSIAALPTLGNA